ncbi:hypothetical protein [Streptomyces sp. NPDC059970]|uniref:hypothetical protein n=1 Tax=Streptomyces sp. NPDC059970 TaxID=3347019 RepID=UPI003674F869
MNLNDLCPLTVRRQDGGLSPDRFRADPALATLQWPDDVLQDGLRYTRPFHPDPVSDQGQEDTP